MLVLDTSALSRAMHRDPWALSRLARRSPDEVLLCTPVAAEIAFGLERLAKGSRRRKLLASEYQRLRDVLSWVDWNEPAALRFGAAKASLARTGRRVDDLDLAIASIALAVGADVATCNRRHFDVIPGLGVEDWSSDPTRHAAD